MALLSTLIHYAADSATADIHHAAALSSSESVIGARVSETVSSGVFPAEVAIVVLGCFVITGFVLLMRETSIEKHSAK